MCKTKTLVVYMRYDLAPRSRHYFALRLWISTSDSFTDPLSDIKTHIKFATTRIWLVSMCLPLNIVNDAAKPTKVIY